jgi:dipeptidyl aminopeptidase/acylaminoacyl peptidase
MDGTFMKYRIFSYVAWGALVGWCGPETPNAAPAPTPTVAAMPMPTPGASTSSTAPTPATPPVVQPDAPQGTDAERDAVLAKDATEIFQAFSNSEPRLTADGATVVFESNRDGLTQLYASDAKKTDSPAKRLVTLDERTGAFSITPDGKIVVFVSDKGAGENWSIFRVGVDGSGLAEITSGETMHRDPPIVVRDVEGMIAYSARPNKETAGRVYLQSMAPGSKPKLVYTDSGASFLIDVTKDGKYGLMGRIQSLSDSTLLLVDFASGTSKPVWPTSGGPQYVSDAAFSPDDATIYLSTDGGAEEADVIALGRDDFKEKARYVEKKPTTARIEGLAVARKQGDCIGIYVDAGNHAELRLLDAKTLKSGPAVTMPLGSGYEIRMSDDGKSLLASWSTPDHPREIYAIDTKSGESHPLRKDPRPTVAKLPKLAASIKEMKSFDGTTVPVNLYLPEPLPKGRKLPTIVSVHGGPASSYEIRWSILNRFFSSHGWAIVEPNVRGSTGFGRKYEQADDYKKRMDAVRDVEEVGKWASAQPWADVDKLVIVGGSYGGYMTLMGVTNHPKLWKAGVDLFGIYSWRTFMTTTSGIIHDVFQKEIGPDGEGPFLDSISPAAKIDQVVAPLFVYAGANDPRVPRSESDAIVKNLRDRKIPVEYMVANNEGHSLDHQANITTFLARAQRFLETNLKIAPPTPKGEKKETPKGAEKPLPPSATVEIPVPK